MKGMFMPQFQKKTIADLETATQISKRINLFKFARLNESTQARIMRGCVKKDRFENINEVAHHLVFKHDNEGVALNFYGCGVCGGYHVTSANKTRRKQIKEMIINLKNNIIE
tara:strand:- start:180 stop:515 length:336 start_codon:yes stop_codon:yes gene_type:complete